MLSEGGYYRYPLCFSLTTNGRCHQMPTATQIPPSHNYSPLSLQFPSPPLPPIRHSLALQVQHHQRSYLTAQVHLFPCLAAGVLNH